MDKMEKLKLENMGQNKRGQYLVQQYVKSDQQKNYQYKDNKRMGTGREWKNKIRCHSCHKTIKGILWQL